MHFASGLSLRMGLSPATKVILFRECQWRRPFPSLGDSSGDVVTRRNDLWGTWAPNEDYEDPLKTKPLDKPAQWVPRPFTSLPSCFYSWSRLHSCQKQEPVSLSALGPRKRGHLVRNLDKQQHSVGPEVTVRCSSSWHLMVHVLLDLVI